MAGDRPFEFQRLHGMGERLHEVVKAEAGGRCRIYAPVGAHEDLLAYLVRRLLENGANSSFVHQIVDESVSAEEIARDPFEAPIGPNPLIAAPSAIFGARANSKGWDLADPLTLARLEEARAPFRSHRWTAGPIIAGAATDAPLHDRVNPANPDDIVGHAADATATDIETALTASAEGFADWSARPAAERAAALRRAADLYDANAPELFALACREAGKTLPDAVGEVREAVDFLRYYAAETEKADLNPRGVFACISPWNFPLAIFTGQIAAALAVGNAVIAKPAEQTPLIAARATALLREAGIPENALQLLPGDGPTVGGPLTSDPRIAGVVFTGGTDTAKIIDRAMAENLAPDAPLIAETGGLNAMIVDSTALTEQAVRDILASAFQSAGQRCSALRMLYVQKDAAERLTRMLIGAMNELRPGDPWDLSTDTGPVIDDEAKARIAFHCATHDVLHSLAAPETGTYAAPTLIRVPGIEALEQEVFGPVLHIATFEAEKLDAVIDAVNATGYGLTFGLHTRIDDRVQTVVERIRAGNIYVNRNQIGAVVGSQPFGGEGLSGTGPKAGGPLYLRRFGRAMAGPFEAAYPPGAARTVPAAEIAAAAARLRPAEGAITSETLPGPTGESNRLSLHPRGVALCLGPSRDAAARQARDARAAGAVPLIVAPGGALDGVIDHGALAEIAGIDAVLSYADADTLRAIRRALAARPGPILPLIATPDGAWRLALERHVCIDTTAAGGNATLLAETAGA
jgi:RHH-type proline utilization regulon transcriptional repressor/proline dehydrogenase/delta 1-pyrroline-5-carboxylate dehydrogenase